MKDTVEGRAVKIAAKVMQAAGLCRYESATRCRRLYTDEATCSRCIGAWLISKAKKELARESAIEDTQSLKWISVKDRLPEAYTDVLLLVKDTEGEEVNYWVFTGWLWDDEWATTFCHGHKSIAKENAEHRCCANEVTHWMPLPKLPRECEVNR
ncbi:MAG: DUF551 domain-containing protein [Clostridia bacterium]|nr:DUF551 domain-containing protein [Clostridia bacterium]